MIKRYPLTCYLLVILALAAASCRNSGKPEEKKEMVKLITLDPGHFHAALVQKTMYDGVDSVVNVYAPSGSDLQLHLNRIIGFNNRAENPSHWKEQVYAGNDFFEKMLKEKKGNVVVLAGNNEKKTEYILQSLEAGFNVLADKPMVINTVDFDSLLQAVKTAKEKNLLLYDIMTERFEITNLLQRELSMLPELFGNLQKGTADDPAVVMESSHCFYKFVAGSILTRPAWFMDVSQQGEGIVDVTTHLVDLVQWECFPNQILDYAKDIDVYAARRWPTDMTLAQFKVITRLDGFPSFLQKDLVNDSTLAVFANGEIHYKIKDVYAKVAVRWDFQSPGRTDTHYSILKGSKANLIIKQGEEEEYRPTLYIEPVDLPEKTAEEQVNKLAEKYPGIKLEKAGKNWKLIIPEKYEEGHEAHFARVMENFLQYLDKKDMPAWEVPGMLAKYYTTTKALERSKK